MVDYRRGDEGMTIHGGKMDIPSWCNRCDRPFKTGDVVQLVVYNGVVTVTVAFVHEECLRPSPQYDSQHIGYLSGYLWG